MAGVGARDIKRRIKSVNSTKQITKAMELVSTAKLKRRRNVLEQAKPYFKRILATVRHIIEHDEGIDHPFLKEREIAHTLYVVIAADRGLCGGYNVNAFKCALNDIEQADKARLYVVGKKAVDFFNNQQFEVIEQRVGIAENPQYQDAQAIAKRALDLYVSGEVDEVKVVYTKMESTILQVADIITLLPVSIEDEERDDEVEPVVDVEDDEFDDDELDEGDYIELTNFRPSPAVVLDYLIPKYFESVVYGCLVESAASEQAARRMAMENATDNAEEMIEDLTLSFNQARQAAITQEISEIVGGANAFD